jgi:hypothetical protein
VVATFVTMLLFLPNAWSGRLCILTLALGMGVVGSLLCHAGKKHKDV